MPDSAPTMGGVADPVPTPNIIPSPDPQSPVVVPPDTPPPTHTDRGHEAPPVVGADAGLVELTASAVRFRASGRFLLYCGLALAVLLAGLGYRLAGAAVPPGLFRIP